MKPRRPKKKAPPKNPAPPMFREAVPAGFVLVERHLRRKVGGARKRRRGR